MALLSLPDLPFFRAGSFTLVSNAERFVSPITRVGQSVARVGDFWECEMQLPPLTEAQAQAWAAIIARLSGQRDSARVGPPIRTTYTPNDPGAVLVNGAAQSGTTLAIDGLDSGETIPAGTWFRYATSTFTMLHITTADATADGAGELDLPIMPAIRKSPADNTTLNFAAPWCEMVLKGQAQILSLSNSIIYGATLSFVENVVS